MFAATADFHNTGFFGVFTVLTAILATLFHLTITHTMRTLVATGLYHKVTLWFANYLDSCYDRQAHRSSAAGLVRVGAVAHDDSVSRITKVQHHRLFQLNGMLFSVNTY